MVDWERYVKKYVWDDDKTPFFIPASQLKQDQANKEIFLYCFFLAIPAAMIVAAFVSRALEGRLDGLGLGLFGLAIICAAAYLNYKKSTTAALFVISAPVVLILHFAINGFHVPNLKINQAAITAVDIEADTLTLEKTKSWQTGHTMTLSTTGALPAPLNEGQRYFLIRDSGSVFQLSATAEEVRDRTPIDLTDPGDGAQTLHRYISLHFIEQAIMIILVLGWLRYTLRAVAITRVYPSLQVRDMNPWSKLPPGANPPRK